MKAEEARVSAAKAEEVKVDSESFVESQAQVHLEFFKINQPASRSLNEMSWALPTENINWVSRSLASYRVNGQLVWGKKSKEGRDINIRWTILHVESKIKNTHQSVEHLPTNASTGAWTVLRTNALRDLSKAIQSLEKDLSKSKSQKETLTNVDESLTKPSKKLEKEGVVVISEAITSQPQNIGSIVFQPSTSATPPNAKIALLSGEVSSSSVVKNDNQEVDNIALKNQQKGSVSDANLVETTGPQGNIKLYLESFKVNQPAAKSVNNMSWTVPVESVKWSSRKDSDYQIKGQLVWGAKSSGNRAIKVVWTIQDAKSPEKITREWIGEVPKNPSASDWESLRFSALEDLASSLSKRQ